MHLLLFLSMKIFSVAIDLAKNCVLLQSNFNLRAYSVQEQINNYDREGKPTFILVIFLNISSVILLSA